MSFLSKCYQSNGVIILKFQKNLDVNSFDVSNFTLNGSITSFSGSNDEVFITCNENSRPIVINCNVKDIDNNQYDISRVVAIEMNYKNFSNREDMIIWYKNNKNNTELDGKIYYDSVDCKIYYDNMGQNLVSDLTGHLLVYLIDQSIFVESTDLNNSIVNGWNPI
jgi:hypothetical protein